MSQDLFAAFGEAPAEPKVNNSVSNPDDDDDFGDFEDASAPSEPVIEQQKSHNARTSDNAAATAPVQKAKSFPPKATPKPAKPESKRTDIGSHPFAGRMDLLFEASDDEYDAGADELADLATNPEAAMAYSKRIIAEQEAAQAKKESHKSMPPKATPTKGIGKKIVSNHSRSASNSDPGPKKLRKKSGYVPANEPEVLFDAENVSDHESSFDDFGDFETEANGSSGVHPIARVERQQNMPAIDLLGLEDPPSAPKNLSGDSQLPPKPILPSRVEETDDDAWDDFEAAPPTSPPLGSYPNTLTRTPSSTQAPSASTSVLAPTNIPPPSVLLSLFPPLFTSADEALFNTMTKLDLKQRQMLLSHPASHKFLKGYLAHCTVLARIIAGRRLRWKRDQRLSQSMCIGPAAAGGKSGMKLAGVNRTELAKEDREVLDTLDRWKGQVGKLRTAVTAASSAPALPKLPGVHEMAENMPVRTLKAGEGGVTAAHACALCGLRREERVAKVDLEVEDSFGEWWVQGMNMHVACKKFWEEFEKKLKSR